MRVTLSVEALSPQLSGIGRYSWELAQRLGAQSGIERLLFCRNGDRVDDPSRLLTQTPYRRHRPWMWRRLSRWIDRQAFAPTLFHGPNYFLPPWAEGGVITVHDLSVFRFPETHPAERIAAFERGFRSSLGRAELVLTDSETVRQELVEDFALDAADICVVPLGVDHRYRPDAAYGDTALRAFGLARGQYALCVSTLEPRKRIIELLDTWKRLPAGLRARFPLVLAGGGGWSNEVIRDRIADAEGQGWLRNLGYVAEDDLPALYAGAALFLYPSLYEGFGLPPLEAMASGTPVIVSPVSCLPETCGAAAAYADPQDNDAYTETIMRCLEDEVWRVQAIALGLARAQALSWEECARRTAEAYKIARP